MKDGVYGKNANKEGSTPSVALVNPKFPRNVAAAMRALSCFGGKQLWWSGDRVSFDPERGRLPREERMKGFQSVELRQFDYFFDQFERDVVPVAVEIRPDTESLHHFVHPEKALYVFGPEDGDLGSVTTRHCQRFVAIPAAHCLNLAAAVYVVLYDRQLKLRPDLTIHDTLRESRHDFPDNENYKNLGLNFGTPQQRGEGVPK